MPFALAASFLQRRAWRRSLAVRVALAALRTGSAATRSATGSSLGATLATTLGAAALHGRALGWPHLLHLFELLGREDLLKLGFDVRLQVRDLLLLIGGEFQSLRRTRWQQAQPARALLLAALRATFRRRRRTVGGRRGRVLSG